MTRILFVHGTGVRRQAFDHVFSLIRSGLHRIRPDFSVEPCLWGEVAGTSLLAAGASIPNPDGFLESSRAEVGKADEIQELTDLEAAIWTILESNPFAELQELAKSSGRLRYASSSNSTSIPNAFEDALGANASVTAALKIAGLDRIAVPAKEILLGSPVCQQVLGNDSVEMVDKIAALSRAFVAICMNELDARLEFKAPIDGLHRDEIIGALSNALGGESRGVGTKLLTGAAVLLLDLGLLSPLEKRRAAFVSRAAPPMGDVLQYLARGDGVREHLRASIVERDEDVIVLAHSLGGIAAVDLLVKEDLEQVTGLVTVGTQVGMLYELNALPSLNFGEKLPDTFPTWDNVLDPRDLLSYSSQGVFPGLARDHYVNNRSPFPRNHSAYFGNPSFYSVLDKVLP